MRHYINREFVKEDMDRREESGIRARKIKKLMQSKVANLRKTFTDQVIKDTEEKASSLFH